VSARMVVTSDFGFRFSQSWIRFKRSPKKIQSHKKSSGSSIGKLPEVSVCLLELAVSGSNVNFYSSLQ
jgi:hypothetical protein